MLKEKVWVPKGEVVEIQISLTESDFSGPVSQIAKGFTTAQYFGKASEEEELA